MLHMDSKYKKLSSSLDRFQSPTFPYSRSYFSFSNCLNNESSSAATLQPHSAPALASSANSISRSPSVSSLSALPNLSSFSALSSSIAALTTPVRTRKVIAKKFTESRLNLSTKLPRKVRDKSHQVDDSIVSFKGLQTRPKGIGSLEVDAGSSTSTWECVPHARHMVACPSLTPLATPSSPRPLRCFNASPKPWVSISRKYHSVNPLCCTTDDELIDHDPHGTFETRNITPTNERTEKFDKKNSQTENVMNSLKEIIARRKYRITSLQEDNLANNDKPECIEKLNNSVSELESSAIKRLDSIGRSLDYIDCESTKDASIDSQNFSIVGCESDTNKQLLDANESLEFKIDKYPPAATSNDSYSNTIDSASVAITSLNVSCTHEDIPVQCHDSKINNKLKSCVNGSMTPVSSSSHDAKSTCENDMQLCTSPTEIKQSKEHRFVSAECAIAATSSSISTLSGNVSLYNWPLLITTDTMPCCSSTVDVGRVINIATSSISTPSSNSYTTTTSYFPDTLNVSGSSPLITSSLRYTEPNTTLAPDQNKHTVVHITAKIKKDKKDKDANGNDKQCKIKSARRIIKETLERKFHSYDDLTIPNISQSVFRKSPLMYRSFGCKKDKSRFNLPHANKNAPDEALLFTKFHSEVLNMVNREEKKIQTNFPQNIFHRLTNEREASDALTSCYLVAPCSQTSLPTTKFSSTLHLVESRANSVQAACVRDSAVDPSYLSTQSSNSIKNSSDYLVGVLGGNGDGDRQPPITSITDQLVPVGKGRAVRRKPDIPYNLAKRRRQVSPLNISTPDGSETQIIPASAVSTPRGASSPRVTVNHILASLNFARCRLGDLTNSLSGNKKESRSGSPPVRPPRNRNESDKTYKRLCAGKQKTLSTDDVAKASELLGWRRSRSATEGGQNLSAMSTPKHSLLTRTRSAPQSQKQNEIQRNSVGINSYSERFKKKLEETLGAGHNTENIKTTYSNNQDIQTSRNVLNSYPLPGLADQPNTTGRKSAVTQTNKSLLPPMPKDSRFGFRDIPYRTASLSQTRSNAELLKGGRSSLGLRLYPACKDYGKHDTLPRRKLEIDRDISPASGTTLFTSSCADIPNLSSCNNNNDEIDPIAADLISENEVLKVNRNDCDLKTDVQLDEQTSSELTVVNSLSGTTESNESATFDTEKKNKRVVFGLWPAVDNGLCKSLDSEVDCAVIHDSVVVENNELPCMSDVKDVNLNEGDISTCSDVQDHLKQDNETNGFHNEHLKSEILNQITVQCKNEADAEEADPRAINEITPVETVHCEPGYIASSLQYGNVEQNALLPQTGVCYSPAKSPSSVLHSTQDEERKQISLKNSTKYQINELYLPKHNMQSFDNEQNLVDIRNKNHHSLSVGFSRSSSGVRNEMRRGSLPCDSAFPHLVMKPNFDASQNENARESIIQAVNKLMNRSKLPPSSVGDFGISAQERNRQLKRGSSFDHFKNVSMHNGDETINERRLTDFCMNSRINENETYLNTESLTNESAQSDNSNIKFKYPTHKCLQRSDGIDISNQEDLESCDSSQVNQDGQYHVNPELITNDKDKSISPGKQSISSNESTNLYKKIEKDYPLVSQLSDEGISVEIRRRQHLFASDSSSQDSTSTGLENCRLDCGIHPVLSEVEDTSGREDDFSLLERVGSMLRRTNLDGSPLNHSLTYPPANRMRGEVGYSSIDSNRVKSLASSGPRGDTSEVPSSSISLADSIPSDGEESTVGPENNVLRNIGVQVQNIGERKVKHYSDPSSERVSVTNQPIYINTENENQKCVVSQASTDSEGKDELGQELLEAQYSQYGDNQYFTSPQVLLTGFENDNWNEKFNEDTFNRHSRTASPSSYFEGERGGDTSGGRSPYGPRRYSKRPLRGPYGEMLEAEMNKSKSNYLSEDLYIRSRESKSSSPCPLSASVSPGLSPSISLHQDFRIPSRTLDDSSIRLFCSEGFNPSTTSPPSVTSCSSECDSELFPLRPPIHQRTKSSPSKLFCESSALCDELERSEYYKAVNKTISQASQDKFVDYNTLKTKSNPFSKSFRKNSLNQDSKPEDEARKNKDSLDSEDSNVSRHTDDIVSEEVQEIPVKTCHEIKEKRLVNFGNGTLTQQLIANELSLCQAQRFQEKSKCSKPQDQQQFQTQQLLHLQQQQKRIQQQKKQLLQHQDGERQQPQQKQKQSQQQGQISTTDKGDHRHGQNRRHKWVSTVQL